MLNGEKKIRSELLVKLIFDKQKFLACMIYNKKMTSLNWTFFFYYYEDLSIHAHFSLTFDIFTEITKMSESKDIT